MYMEDVFGSRHVYVDIVLGCQLVNVAQDGQELIVIQVR